MLSMPITMKAAAALAKKVPRKAVEVFWAEKIGITGLAQRRTPRR